MTLLPLAVQVALISVVLIAAFSDVKSREIPNWLTVGGIVLGFGLNPYNLGWSGLKLAAMGFGVAALVFLPLFMLRWLGGGDAKLMAAIGALAGPTNLIVIFIVDAVLGGIAALALVLARGRLRQTVRNIGRMLSSLFRGRAPYQESEELEAGSEKSFGMPRAVTIATATLLVLWATPK